MIRYCGEGVGGGGGGGNLVPRVRSLAGQKELTLGTRLRGMGGGGYKTPILTNSL